MSSTASQMATGSVAKSRLWIWLGWALVLSCLAYFVVKKVPRYFVLTEHSYGSYFWAKASWLLPHVVCGLLAAVIGPLQFWPRIRRDYLSFHRFAGRVYVVAVLVGAAASLGLSTKVGADDAAYAWGLIGLAAAWIATTGMAFVAIRKKNLIQHQQWMVRSYVVTFAFVSFRLADDLMRAGNIFPEAQRGAILAWGCWAVPLLFAEMALQAGAIFKQRTGTR